MELHSFLSFIISHFDAGGDKEQLLSVFFSFSLSGAPSQHLPEKTYLSQALSIKLLCFVFLLLTLEQAFHSAVDNNLWCLALLHYADFSLHK